MQPGWLRFSLDAGRDAPWGITIENNVFHYPYVWPEHEDPETAMAVRSSESNASPHGRPVADGSWPEYVTWQNNDEKYKS